MRDEDEDFGFFLELIKGTVCWEQRAFSMGL
jgi:hypothetical protein